MRTLRVTSYYSRYLANYDSLASSTPDQSYDELHAALMEDSFGFADFWSEALKPFGYESWDIPCNAEGLQKRWAEENGIDFSEDDWLREILFAQLRTFQPELVILHDSPALNRAFIDQMRSTLSNLHLVVAWCGTGYHHPEKFSGCDLVLSNIPEVVDQLRQDGLKSHYLPHAFAPKILERIDTSRRSEIPFSFIGSILLGDELHRDREQLILNLVDSTPLELFTAVSGASIRETLSMQLKQFLYLFGNAVGTPAERVWDLLPGFPNLSAPKPHISWRHHPKIVKRAKPPIFGVRMFQLLSDSAVTLNAHISASSKSASNMRMFEATGAGCCLLTDEKENMRTLFEPDSEVVTYSSHEECIEKANWLLNNPEKRQSIAEAGQRRTLAEHTYSHRAEKFVQLLQSHLKTQRTGDGVVQDV